jgi:hypothetical protein
MGTRQRVRREDRPTVTQADATAAVAAVAARHLAADAPYAEELSDDPTEMLAHLRKRSVNFSRDLRVQDYPDVKVISRWVTEYEARKTELWTLEQGKLLGFSNRQIGADYGLLSRQGVPDRIKTLRHLVRGASADAQAQAGADSSSATGAAGRPLTAAERELEWLAANRRRILALAGELLAYEHLADNDAADWLAEVKRDVDDSACTPASFVILRCAADDLASSPGVADLGNEHPLTTLIGEWRSLDAERGNIVREHAGPGTSGR